MKRCGGLAIVQDPENALYPSMPTSALHNCPVDHTVTLSELPVLLARLARSPAGSSTRVPAIIDMETQFGGMQQDIQTLINSVDSLRAVVAYQDTLISRLATLTNVPWPPPRR